MDWTPFIHAAIAVAVQVLVGLVTGNWWLGGAIACAWWAAREHTQAEYRWIAAYAGGRRAAMPWWGGFDLRIWDSGSVLDAWVPLAACVVLFLWVR
jgi:hypothetical protein